MNQNFKSAQGSPSLKIFALALGASFLQSAGTYASSDWIVRFRAPQNNSSEALNTLLKINPTASGHFKSGLKKNVQVLNSEEGVVKLSFADEENAKSVLQNLIQSGEVLNVAKNFLYRPALHLASKEVSPSQKLSTQGAFTITPFLDSPSVPDVLMPPALDFIIHPILYKFHCPQNTKPSSLRRDQA